jgi:hypothetical protein
MKNLATLTLIFLFGATSLVAQKIEDDVSFQILSNEFGNDYEVVIKNIFGDVEVEGYEGDYILVEATREIWKERGRVSESDLNDFQLKTMVSEDRVFIYVDAPGVEIDFDDGRVDYRMNWRNEDDIYFYFDINVKIPQSMDIDASTINDGIVVVNDMSAAIEANNVNGAIKVVDARSRLEANTVNGKIEVWFAESPSFDMEFHSVNGEISIYSPKDFGAVVTFESLNGDLYTDFDNVKRLPNQLNRAESRGGNRYKLTTNAPIQIGDGGPTMDFKLVNGNVFIRERES